MRDLHRKVLDRTLARDVICPARIRFRDLSSDVLTSGGEGSNFRDALKLQIRGCPDAGPLAFMLLEDVLWPRTSKCGSWHFVRLPCARLACAVSQSPCLPGQSRHGKLRTIIRCQDVWCARLTDGMSLGESPGRKRGQTSHFLREPCAGRREAAGEALASGGRGPGHRATKNDHVRSAEAFRRAEGNTLHAGLVRRGGAPRGLRTMARAEAVHRDLGGLDVTPTIASGSPEEGGIPVALDARHRGVRLGHSSDEVREQKRL